MAREFIKAIKKGDIEEVRAFEGKGYDLTETTEKEGWNYLHRALLMPTLVAPPDMVRYLIDRGVDANAVDVYGNTPLYYAVRSKASGAVSVLVDAGVDVNHLNKDGISPLRESLIRKPFDHESIRLLLEAGADPEQKKEDGITVREFAERRDESLAELFKEN
ncbi:MAG: ankyrin repeat domain-containing protein [Woeseiaceae bacterium]|nr:ankyrin repeat domain-containing protein [Woeseiaceae bacterium]